jgi:hypothetical protein
MTRNLFFAVAMLAAALNLAASAARGQVQYWIHQLGTNQDDWAWALAPDGAGGAFVAGPTWGSLGGPNAWVRSDAWLARYDAAGDRLCIRQFGTNEHDWASALAPDGAGGAFVAGQTEGSLGGPNAGQIDAWLARYDAAGNRLSIRQFGTNASDWASALAPDGAGGAFVAGQTQGSLGGPSAGGYDAWLARWGPCYADCNGDGVLNLADFGCFKTRFALGCP